MKKYVKVALTEAELSEFKKYIKENKNKKVLKEHGRGQDIELRDSNPNDGDILGRTSVYQREDMRVEKLFRKELYTFKIAFMSFLDQFGIPYTYRTEFTPLDDKVALELKCTKNIPKLKKGEEDDSPILSGRVLDGITRILNRHGFRIYPGTNQSFDIDVRVDFNREGVEEFKTMVNNTIVVLEKYGERNNKRI